MNAPPSSTLERTIQVGAEAARFITQQQELQPYLQIPLDQDASRTQRLQDVGHRVHRLEESNRHRYRSPKKDGKQEEVKTSQYAALASADWDDESAMTELLKTMQMDQEWDTRSWTKLKIHAAIDHLYDEIGLSDDDRRRTLATRMLVRLLETRSDARDHIDTTLPMIMNKAFKSPTSGNEKLNQYRFIILLSTLAEWFPYVMSKENAVARSIKWLTEEADCCAQLVQHQWRRFISDRHYSREGSSFDATLRARQRVMQMFKYMTLQHRLKAIRKEFGPSSLLPDVMLSCIKILSILTTPPSADSNTSRITRMNVDQRRVLTSGVLSVIVPYISTDNDRSRATLVIQIVSNLSISLSPECIIDILSTDVIRRALQYLQQVTNAQLNVTCDRQTYQVLELITSLAAMTAQAFFYDTGRETSSSSRRGQLRSRSEEDYVKRVLQSTTRAFLVNVQIINHLLQFLQVTSHDNAARIQLLISLKHLIAAEGRTPMLECLTKNGGRYLTLLLQLMVGQDLVIAANAFDVFHELTKHQDARDGLTSAGAVRALLSFIHLAKAEKERVVAMTTYMSLIGIVLLSAYDRSPHSIEYYHNSFASIHDRIYFFYEVLLSLVLSSQSDRDNNRVRIVRQTASFWHDTQALSSLLSVLVQVHPKCMSPPMQSKRQRNISCIVLGRFCRSSKVTPSLFSEDTVVHLALSLQSNRMDILEQGTTKLSQGERYLNQVGDMEALRALSRLARCPSTSVNASLRPSLTSYHVPEWPQALVCDVLTRLHVLEDIVMLIRVPTDAAEFPTTEVEMVSSAIELVGYIPPFPFGSAARDQFLRGGGQPEHIKYTKEKHEHLIKVSVPSILRVLRDENCILALIEKCCASLSRLACNPASSQLLLSMGCLGTAVVHLPQMLVCTPVKKAVITSHSDDSKLLRIPSSLYTLLSRLCLVEEGRQQLIRAQVLPRILRRAQVSDPSSQKDCACKGEIAAIIAEVAPVNAIEGAGPDLFLRYRVLEWLTAILRKYLEDKKKDKVIGRCMSNAVKAIAALSQDVLVWVPRIIQLDVIAPIAPFLRSNTKNEVARDGMIQRDAVKLLRNVASYPLGTYNDIFYKDICKDESSPVILIDLLRSLHFANFAAKARGMQQNDLSEDTKEILRLLERCQVKPTSVPVISIKEGLKKHSPRIESVQADQNVHVKVDLKSEDATCNSYIKEEEGIIKAKAMKVATNTCKTNRFVVSSPKKTDLQGIDIEATRPQSISTTPLNSPSRTLPDTESNYYTFARPKRHVLKSKNTGLMLDPLFQLPGVAASTDPTQKSSSDILDASPRELLHELDQLGHFVEVKAMRNQSPAKRR